MNPVIAVLLGTTSGHEHLSSFALLAVTMVVAAIALVGQGSRTAQKTKQGSHMAALPELKAG